MNGGFRRFVVIMLLVGFVLTIATISLAYTVITRAGVVAFDVTDYDERVRVHFGIPAFPLNLMLRVVDAGFFVADPDVRHVMRAAARELDTMPNVLLVQVEGENGETVKVRTWNRDLLIEVDAPDADVRVRVPRTTFRRLAQ